MSNIYFLGVKTINLNITLYMKNTNKNQKGKTNHKLFIYSRQYY